MKRLLSYFIPLRPRIIESSINGQLEINYLNGKKMLDTEVSNYSYGSLQKILHKGLVEVGLDEAIRNILILGMGGGSVIESIREKMKSRAFLTAVEIDPKVIEIAREEFNVDRFQALEIFESDAYEYVVDSNKEFDLIIVDLFIGNKIPEKFTQAQFINLLCKRLSNRGKILFNTMAESLPKETFLCMLKQFSKNALSTTIMEKVEGSNNLLIAEKQQ